MSVEAEFEQAVDRVVMLRLQRDRAYRNAENAEQQAERELEITEQVIAEHRARWRCKRCGVQLVRVGQLLLCNDCEGDL